MYILYAHISLNQVAHSVDEAISKEEFLAGVDLYKNIVVDLHSK